MEETTVDSRGAGLAATQVGRTERICIARIHQKLTPLLNPEITWISTTLETAEEGCLSLPETWAYVPRPKEVILQYMSTDGKHRELKLTGWDARVVQHEIDHLDGILIVDYRNAGITSAASSKPLQETRPKSPSTGTSRASPRRSPADRPGTRRTAI